MFKKLHIFQEVVEQIEVEVFKSKKKKNFIFSLNCC
jgi:hypothetical protein